MKSIALFLIVGILSSANCQLDISTEYVEKLWAEVYESFVSIPGEDVTVSNFNTTLKSEDGQVHIVSFQESWFWMSDIASTHTLDRASIKSEVNDVESTVKFNVNLKGCQIGWSAYLYSSDGVTSHLNCSYDIDTIPYEIVVTKKRNRHHLKATFKFAGMHSPRLVILTSLYLPPKTRFALMLKHAMDTDMSFRESMGDVFASITKKGQTYLLKAVHSVDFPEEL